MQLQWFFTSPALEEYMKIAVWKKWDTSEVGTRLEAFMVGGYDAVSEYCKNNLKIVTLTTIFKLQTYSEHLNRRQTI